MTTPNPEVPDWEWLIMELGPDAADLRLHRDLEDLFTLERAGLMSMGFNHGDALDMVCAGCDAAPENFSERAVGLGYIRDETVTDLIAFGFTQEQAEQEWLRMLTQSHRQLAEHLERQVPLTDQ